MTTMRDFSADHRWLSINTATLRGAGTLDRIIECCVRHGIRAISPWRDQVHAIGLERTAELVREHTLELSGYCRGGMYPAIDAAGRRRAIDDNRRAIDEARALDAACLVLVVGSLPGALEGRPQSKDLFAARSDVHDGIAATLEHARAADMPLAIEPLHPMYAADRACVNTLEQALDLCDAIDPATGEAPAAEHEHVPLSASRSTSTTCGGTRSSKRRSRAPGASGCWRSTSATGSCRPGTC
jgi:sugar phosphate isomerase/epimerase